MTSSPAPDLDELERLFDSSAGADFLPVGWQAVFGYVPALLTELRAARAAVAESGRLREALDMVAPFLHVHGWVWPPDLIAAATPPAPSDHGALAPERLTAAIMAAVGASHPDDFGIAYRQGGFSPAGLAAAVLALLPPSAEDRHG